MAELKASEGMFAVVRLDRVHRTLFPTGKEYTTSHDAWNEARALNQGIKATDVTSDRHTVLDDQGAFVTQPEVART